MAQPNVVLMSAGYRLIAGEEGNYYGTKVFFDAATRTDKAAVTLPLVGDAWDDVLTGLYCRTVEKAPIGDDTSAGFMYICTYSTFQTDSDVLSSNRATPEVSVSVSTDASFDSYTHDPATSATIYKTADGTNFTAVEDLVSITRLTPHTSVAITDRYTGSITDLLASNASLVGRVNNAAMWGIGIGCILFNGVTANPIKYLQNGITVVKWNRVYNYSIRYLPGITENTWQYVFINGEYVRLSSEEGTGGYADKDPYPSATLPDPLS